MRDEISAAAISFTANDDKERNIQTAITYVEKAARLGAQWVQLPEVFTYMGPYDRLYDMAEDAQGPLLKRLGQVARDLGIVLFAGSFAERPEAHEAEAKAGIRKVYNTSYVIDRAGQVIGRYRKIHLFNLFGPKGERLYCEEDGYLPGRETVCVDVDGFRVGLSICYDLRFPEFFARLTRAKAVDVIVLPAAFTLGTGMYHWEPLLRARAIENQCYLYAANQVGNHSPGKSTYGYSMIIDPWGHVLASSGSEPDLALARISKARVAEVRARVPSLQNRRPELY